MYFDSTGPANTGETVAIAVREAKERKVSHIIIASNTGKTAEALAAEARKAGYDGRIICVSHVNGFRENGVNELSDENRQRLVEQGVQVYTGSHVLSGAERAISRTFHGAYPVEIIAHSLRMLGSGVKVAVEISVMALDGGLIPHGKPVIGIGGTGGGADTAALLTPGHASAIFETRIHEILCKPR
ncbi:conserved hypothetical protein [Treponema primitia ZAS-2]|uniref:Pyruvate kinase C-terminal domain-containing protein n=1 Tax=Treponema primitia (strain ATCC BAA-887 / DSM 12427 / ZAS-2) TaxID=545694 RepID=F5YH90_TREPZ|nr:pyruvate kinase alpha/beta domain-containing protein [Treponema primitia]AEF83554.1 conserved hypothetical protein [Treponema primitia ZAS-2]